MSPQSLAPLSEENVVRPTARTRARRRAPSERAHDVQSNLGIDVVEGLEDGHRESLDLFARDADLEIWRALFVSASHLALWSQTHHRST